MWAARDSDGDLFLYKSKPERVYRRATGYWQAPDDTNNDVGCEVFEDFFPNLKWEDEPIEVNIVPIKELLETERELKDVYHKLINYQTAIIQLRNNMKTLDGDMRKWIDENFLDLTIE